MQESYTHFSLYLHITVGSNIILLNSLPSWLKYSEGGSVPIVRLEQTPGRVIQNDYKSCNMDVRIDTSQSPLLLFSPIPPYSSGFQGSDRVVGARPTGLDWLTRLAWSQPTSPWFSPASFHIPHPPFLPQNSARTMRGEKGFVTSDFLQGWRHVHRERTRLSFNQ